MYNFIKRNHNDTTAVAMIEGLLICLPIWMFFVLILHVLNYWELNHLDQVMQLSDTMAHRVVSTDSEHLKTKSSTSKKGKDAPQFTLEKQPKSKRIKTPFYYYYITYNGKTVKRVAGMRRFNTWLSYPLLKGQNRLDEAKSVQEWYDDMGNKVLNENRGHLLLGS